jgi:Holliday junction resolvase RusA-like endonuclease
MDRASFYLPLAPSTNALYANTPHGRRKVEGYRKWLQEAGWRIKEQRVQPVPGKRWGLAIAAPVTYRRDLDNVLKATCDLLVEMQIIKNDRWIDDIRLVRVEQGTEMHVALWAIDAAPSTEAALKRLRGYRGLATVARGVTGLALGEDGQERDGKPPRETDEEPVA